MVKVNILLTISDCILRWIQKGDCMRIKYATLGIITGLIIIAFLKWIGVPISAFNVFSLLGEPTP